MPERDYVRPRDEVIAQVMTFLLERGYTITAPDGRPVVPPQERTCDHPGIEHGVPGSYCWPCPRCGVCKFIGHGPLCIDCGTQDIPTEGKDS